MINVKKRIAEVATEFIRDGNIVGLGSGSTAYWVIRKLGEQVKNGMQIKAVATSGESESLARELKIPVVTFSEIDYIDITIDGADEVSPGLDLVKGGGGALLREKIVATASRKVIIVADETKRVKQLGQFPLPVEVVPFGVEVTRRQIEKLRCKTEIRMKDKNNRYITDNGNYILDCKFGLIERPEEISLALNAIPGVVENGLFINVAHQVLIGYKNGDIISMKKEGKMMRLE